MENLVYRKYHLEVVEDNNKKYKSFKVYNTKVNCSKMVAEVNRIFKLDKRAEEYVLLICVNTKNYIIGMFEVSHGDTNSNFVRPANVFKRALSVNANRIIVCHNHPSGDATPSKNDYELTDELYDAGELLGIELLDHIVVGHNNEYVSILHNYRKEKVS